MVSGMLSGALSRKYFVICHVLAAMAVAFGSSASMAEPALPQGTVKIVVPYPAGGPLDVSARIVGKSLEKSLNRVVLVENKAGANGNIGSDYVAKAAPDGMTLLWVLSNTLTANPSLYKTMSYDPDKDLIPIGIPVTFTQMLTVVPSMPVNSVSDFVAYAKAHKDHPISYGSGGGVGSPAFLAMEYFKSLAGFPALHVPYKGAAPLLNDMLSGVINSTFMVSASSVQYVKQGKLKGLAISGSKRSPLAPEIPTMAEVGYSDFVIETGFVLLAPKGTPKDIVAMLESDLRKAVTSPDVQTRIRALGLEPGTAFGAAAGAALASEKTRWTKVIKEAGIPPF